MKKVRILAVLAITGILLACASTEVTGELGLDAAIQMASRDISGALPAGTKVALLNFSSPSDVFSSYVLEEMSIYLVRDRNLIVVDRREIDLIRSEMDFQMSGEVSDESAQSIGRMLGAQSIISGSWLTIGDSHRFRTRVINVNTAAIETSKSITVNDSPTIQHLLAQGYNRPAAPQMAAVAPAPTAVAPPALAEPATAPAIPAYVPAAPVAPAAPALREFRIGDIGPAGGIIFFDQGSNAGGWRFLEAAPMEAEFQAPWSVRNTAVRDTRPEIGSGRRNTQLILETFRQTAGEWDTAAQMADDLVINGFDDWFLPSRDELDQMFGNLRRRNLGDFRNGWYWSSSGWWPNRQNFNNG